MCIDGENILLTVETPLFFFTRKKSEIAIATKKKASEITHAVMLSEKKSDVLLFMGENKAAFLTSKSFFETEILSMELTAISPK